MPALVPKGRSNVAHGASRGIKAYKESQSPVGAKEICFRRPFTACHRRQPATPGSGPGLHSCAAVGQLKADIVFARINRTTISVTLPLGIQNRKTVLSGTPSCSYRVLCRKRLSSRRGSPRLPAAGMGGRRICSPETAAKSRFFLPAARHGAPPRMTRSHCSERIMRWY